MTKEADMNKKLNVTITFLNHKNRKGIVTAFDVPHQPHQH